jgi:hypothetical protein
MKHLHTVADWLAAAGLLLVGLWGVKLTIDGAYTAGQAWPYVAMILLGAALVVGRVTEGRDQT